MLYFAYGSNLNHQQMEKRCSGAKFIKKYTLRGFKLCFSHKTNHSIYGHANIVKNKKSKVDGAIWNINKKILRLASVGMFFLAMLPESLYANHFRYGTMSWEPISDNGTHVTIRLKMQNGWTANHSFISAYTAGQYKEDAITIYWGDTNNNSTVDLKVLSRDNTSNDTITEIGDYSSSTWTSGVTYAYPDNGTTEYTVYWGSSSRESVENSGNGSAWRNETKINIGGSYDGNSSPVSAVPPVVQVQDNTEFNYQLVSTDADGDSLNYRWGTIAEFFLAYHKTKLSN